MHNSTTTARFDETQIIKFASAATFVLLTIYLIGSRSAPFLLSLLALMILSLRPPNRPGWIKPELTPLLMGFLIFGGYLFINSSWSWVPATAYGKAALYLTFVALVVFSRSALAAADDRLLDRLALNIMLAFAIGLLYLAIELFFDAPLKKLAISYFPFLTPSLKHIKVADDGWVTFVRSYTFNRNVAAMSLILWPVLLFGWLRFKPKIAGLTSGAILLAALVVIAASAHETSKLAVSVSIAIFLLAKISPKASRRLIGAGWIVATLLMLPLVFFAFSQNLHKADWIQHSGQERIIIWHYTATQTLKNPILGVGIQSTKPIQAKFIADPNRPKEKGFRKGTGRHAHNIFLQTWYELGGLGALLLCSLGLLLLHSTSKLNSLSQPYILAAITCAMATSAFSYGMWQPWFMACFGISAILSLMAIELASRRG